MRVIHILDHSIPLQSGYAFRTLSILKEQRALGWETFHLTGPKQGPAAAREEDVNGWHFYRTPPPGGMLEGVPVLSEVELMGEIAYRVEQIARRVRPHILHAHSPVLNAIPALWVGKRLGIPVVYEVRALWEDAAVDHGTAREGGLRYRLSRWLESWALKRVDAVTTICEGLRGEIVGPRHRAGKGHGHTERGGHRGILHGRRARSGPAREASAWTALSCSDSSARSMRTRGWRCCCRPCAACIDRGENVRALLVGGGRQEAELKQLAAELGIARAGRVRRPRAPR